MPTPVAHALAGTGIYLSSSRRRDRWLWLTAVIAACFADIDFGISFLAHQNYHHYFTHSLGFTTFFGLGAYFFSRLAGRPRPGRDALILGAAYLSHVLLDMLSKDTAAPYGVELFWPFSDTFTISPVLVFDDIWRGTFEKLLGLHNWLAVLREIFIVGPVVLWLGWRRRHSP